MPSQKLIKNQTLSKTHKIRSGPLAPAACWSWLRGLPTEQVPFPRGFSLFGGFSSAAAYLVGHLRPAPGSTGFLMDVALFLQPNLHLVFYRFVLDVVFLFDSIVDDVSMFDIFHILGIFHFFVFLQGVVICSSRGVIRISRCVSGRAWHTSSASGGSIT